jgi:hypothetical protein
LRQPYPRWGGGDACDSGITGNPYPGKIQHNRNWGATAAGQSPWSVIRKEIFYRAHGDNKFKGNESVKTPSEHDILPEKDY